MFIYCSGDSFTRGIELADETIPHWPGPVCSSDSDQVKKAKAWADKYRNETILKLTIPQRIEMHRIETERAWPNKLATLVGATVVNNGRGGSSQDDTNYRTMIDIERLVASGQKIDKVFIQITEAARFALYNRPRESWETDHLITSRLTVCADHYQYNDKMLVKFWDVAQPDPDKHVRLLTQLTMIRNYVKAKLGFEPIFIDSLFMRYIQTNLNSLKNTAIDNCGELNILMETSGVVDPLTLKSNIISMEQLEDVNKPHRCPGGHFSEEVHDLFAQLLAKTYF